jgi:hypothetical protein
VGVRRSEEDVEFHVLRATQAAETRYIDDEVRASPPPLNRAVLSSSAKRNGLGVPAVARQPAPQPREPDRVIAHAVPDHAHGAGRVIRGATGRSVVGAGGLAGVGERKIAVLLGDVDRVVGIARAARGGIEALDVDHVAQELLRRARAEGARADTVRTHDGG